MLLLTRVKSAETAWGKGVVGVGFSGFPGIRKSLKRLGKMFTTRVSSFFLNGNWGFKDFQGMFSFFWRDKEDIRCISAGSNEEQLGYTSAAGMLWMVASRRS